MYNRTAVVLMLGLLALMLGCLYLERRAETTHYQGPVDGIFDRTTQRAVGAFPEHRGLWAGGFVDGQTGDVLTTCEPVVPAGVGPVVYRSDLVDLLARLIMAEAGGEPYLGKVAVGAVILNRIKNAAFPGSLPGVVYQPLAFESVANGSIWRPVSEEARRAAEQCLAGWDPTHGAVYFWNPGKPVNPWVWTRNIITQIGHHVFAR